MIVAGLIGAVVAVLLTVLALNFIGGEKRIEHRLEHHYGVDDAQFLRELGTLLGPPIIDGNRVVNLENGAQIFPAMLAAIRGARENINFETYIYWSGAIGREFADALSERARAGVDVHVLIDWLGSKSLDTALVDEMKAAGVEVELYHPLRWYSLGRMNNRTHRKLLVVDGTVGFTGGVGIADKWAGNADSPDHWRDSHYELHGPAVAQMQAAFLDNWIKATGTVLQGEDYFPRLEPVGDARGQVFTASPHGRRREHAAHVPACRLRPRCARSTCPLRISYRTSSRVAPCAPRSSAACACASSCRATASTPSSCARPRARSGANCYRPVPRSTSTSRRCSTARR